MNQQIETEIPTQFSHSVKIEQSAKGARVTVHVNANNGLEAMEQIDQSVSGYKVRTRTAKRSSGSCGD